MSGVGGRLALLAASLVFTCALAEGGLRLAGYGALHDVYSKPELFWRYDARLGWALEPGARGRYVGPRPFPVEFDTEVAINALGLRGPELGRRAPGELRVLLLGDSVVAGFEVEQADTFAALAEAELRSRLERPLRVVNAGIRGYGTDQSLLWLRERGLALDPDVVALVFSANDFDDNLTLHRARRPFGKGAYALRPSGALELVGVPVPRFEPCSTWTLDERYEPARVDGWSARAACVAQLRLADRSALFSVVAMALGRLPGLVRLLGGIGDAGGEGGALQAGLVPWPLASASAAGAPGPARPEGEDRAAALTTALLQALARDTRAAGARFLLLITPRHFERCDARALLADQIEPHAVPLPAGVAMSELRFRNDSHLNARGHRVYAEGLVPLLEAELRQVLARRERAAPAPR